jgi:hypothetical protein
MFHNLSLRFGISVASSLARELFHTGCRYSRSSLWVINSSTALLDLNGSRWRKAKLFPSRGVKLPCLSARSQSFVDVVFGPI